jgi:hypothetical protein
MKLTRSSAIEAFAPAAEPFLLAREAEHNLVLGLCSTLLRAPDHYPEPPYLALVTEGEDVLAAALRTPPYNLILSYVAPEVADGALALLAGDALGRARRDPPVADRAKPRGVCGASGSVTPRRPEDRETATILSKGELWRAMIFTQSW